MLRNIRTLVLVVMTVMSLDMSAYNWVWKLYRDPETTAYLTGAAADQYYEEEMTGRALDNIREYYLKANVSLAGITTVKHLERKALHDAGLLGGPGSENYYYQHIYKLVYSRIIPQVFRVAVLLVDHIDQAYVWLPQLNLICEEVRALCGQFSAVCANGNLSFNFGFPMIAEEVLGILGLGEMAHVDWRGVFDSLSDIEFHFDADSIYNGVKGDIQDIYEAGGRLLSSGGSGLDSVWANSSNVGKVFSGSPLKLANRLDSLRDVYEKMIDESDVMNKMTAFLGTVDSATVLQKLFSYKDCRPEDFLRDFTRQKTNSYYRQTWYITRNGVRVYEDVFDSSRQSEEVFSQYMTAKKNELEVAEDEGRQQDDPPSTAVFAIVKGEKVSWEEPEEMKLKGVSQAVFFVRCDEGGAIAEGSWTFKVDPRHDPLNEKSKVYAFETHHPDGYNTSDKDECFRRLDAWRQTYDGLSRNMSSLSSEIDKLYYMYSQGTLVYGGKPILDAISELEKQRDKVNQDLDMASDSVNVYTQAYNACVEDMEAEEDIFRIPHIMRLYEAELGLQWLEEGHWDGFTWVRRCYYPAAKVEMTLRVKLKVDAKEKYLFGIKGFIRIARSRITMEYGLYYGGETENAVEYVDLDPEADEEDNLAIIEEHRKRWQEDYPDCEVSVETVVREGVKDSIDNHTVHLLWAADRLRIARAVNARLEYIYAQLQVMERTLLFTKSLYERLKMPIGDIFTSPVTRDWLNMILQERKERMMNNSGQPKGRPKEEG